MCARGSKIGFRSPIFDDFFLRSMVSPELLFWLRRFFFKAMNIQFSFQIKKETVRKIETFEKKLKFSLFDRFRFFTSLIRISIFFEKFEISLDYGFLDWKGYKIVSSLQKTWEKFYQRFLRYRTSKKKYHLNFATCGFGTLIFDP